MADAKNQRNTGKKHVEYSPTERDPQGEKEDNRFGEKENYKPVRIVEFDIISRVMGLQNGL